ncbi:MAG: hypothetical protein AAFZ07_09350, partial [Actinomycetota bacterium]
TTNAPETTTPDTTTASETTGPDTTTAPAVELDADQQAVADAWSAVFDSTVPFDDKAPHLAEAEALRETVDAYASTGDTFGGISLVPTAVLVEGESATVTYDVFFGENAAYDALSGAVQRVDGVWVVSREEFCGFMASARTPCT